METRDKIEDLQSRINKYEEDGVAKLYYALNRKAWEMADLLNGTNLKSLDITDGKDKSFERLKAIWSDAASIASAVKALGENAGITGDEVKDIKKNLKAFTPESIADAVGELAGHKKY